MGFINTLKHEHSKLSFMLEEISQLKNGERKTHDYLGSFQRIIAHEGAEEDTLYTLLVGSSELQVLADRGLYQQASIREAIQDMSSISPDNQLWEIRLTRLRGLLADHFHTEEDEIFPMAAQTLGTDEIDALGEEYETLRKELETPPSRILNRV